MILPLAFLNFIRKRRGAINAKQLSYLEKYRAKRRLNAKVHKNSCCLQWKVKKKSNCKYDEDSLFMFFTFSLEFHKNLSFQEKVIQTDSIIILL